MLTHDNEGTHVELGVEVARRYGESGPVINCIQAHHDDVPHESAESVLVQAADAISGARPGARREAFETYVKRLTRLEEIANAFPGVEKSNVIQAGREVRVVVTPERIDDGAAALLSETIARKIEHELQYPGQIKVVVIRETTIRGLRPMSARVLDGVPHRRRHPRGGRGGRVKRQRSAEAAGLAVVIVGENPASQVYVKAKGKACEEAGMHSETVRLPEDVPRPSCWPLVDRLNRDPRIHGFLVQLPLPKHINSERVLNAINPGQGRGRLSPGQRRQAEHRRPDRAQARHAVRRAADADPLGHRDQGAPTRSSSAARTSSASRWRAC